jgi:hypothetical protein
VLATLLLFLGTATAITAPSAAAEEDCHPNAANHSIGFTGGQNGYFLPCDNSGDTHIFYDNNSDGWYVEIKENRRGKREHRRPVHGSPR